MSTTVKAQPEGYRAVTPYITCKDAAAAIEYYKKVFGATEAVIMPGPGGMIMHAELNIGDSKIMLGDEFPGMSKAPDPSAPISARSGGIFVYTDDVDALMQRAKDAGSRVDMPLENMFWGDRYGKFTDPFGHSWAVATHIEDVSPEEMQKRTEAMSKQMAQSQSA
jgi:PhnB protein